VVVGLDPLLLQVLRELATDTVVGRVVELELRAVPALGGDVDELDAVTGAALEAEPGDEELDSDQLALVEQVPAADDIRVVPLGHDQPPWACGPDLPARLDSSTVSQDQSNMPA